MKTETDTTSCALYYVTILESAPISQSKAELSGRADHPTRCDLQGEELWLSPEKGINIHFGFGHTWIPYENIRHLRHRITTKCTITHTTSTSIEIG